MIVFRFHRGTLAESLETAKEFTDLDEAKKYIVEWFEKQPIPFKIHYYPYDLKAEFYCYDDRIGTNDYIITAYNRVSANYDAVGMYSNDATLKKIQANYKKWEKRDVKDF